MKKVAFVATVVKTHINAFHLPYLKWFQEQGWETHVCAKNDFIDEACVIPCCDHYYDIPFSRSPLNRNNIEAYKKFREIVEENDFDIVHCHTPVGGVIARLACRKARKKGTKVVYTAHGFHFYKGAPLLNWLVYYPIERWLARYTDVLITINREDYARAQKFKAGKVEYVPGVGVDTERFCGMLSREEARAKKEELGIGAQDVILLSVGELIARKNHKAVIHAIKKISDPHLRYLIVGRGALEAKLQAAVEQLGLTEQIKLLGFRKDIAELCAISDLFVFPSYQEGLPVALMEAMAAGLPVICSNIRGNTDLIADGEGGFLHNPEDVGGFAASIQVIVGDPALREKMGGRNRTKVQDFSKDIVQKRMQKIYKSG